jgi:hypothetical protein
MFHPSPSSKVATACAVAALLLGVGLSPANAAVNAGVTSVSQQTGSGSWGAVATAQAAPPYGTGPFLLSFASASLIKYKFFNLANTGTVTLLSASLALTVVPTTATIIIESCSTTWNESLDLCVGGIVRTLVSSATPLVTTMAFPSPSLSSIRLRATLSSLSFVDVAVTVNVSVPRTSARPASITSS